jgi:hypothetical protein
VRVALPWPGTNLVVALDQVAAWTGAKAEPVLAEAAAVDLALEQLYPEQRHFLMGEVASVDDVT